MNSIFCIFVSLLMAGEVSSAKKLPIDLPPFSARKLTLAEKKFDLRAALIPPDQVFSKERNLRLKKEIDAELEAVNRSISSMKSAQIETMTRVSRRALDSKRVSQQRKLVQLESRLHQLQQREKQLEKKMAKERKLVQLRKEFESLAPQPRLDQLKEVYRKAGVTIDKLGLSDMKFLIKNSKKLLKSLEAPAPLEVNGMVPPTPYPQSPSSGVMPIQISGGLNPQQLQLLHQALGPAAYGQPQI